MSVKEQKNEGVSPLLAAVAGAVVGAGVAIAGAVALSNKKNLAKVEGALTHAKDKANGLVKSIQNKVKGTSASVNDTKETVKKTLSKTADSVSVLAQKAKKEVNKI